MRRRFKKALSLLSAAAMCFSMALSLPEGTIGWGILANAEGGFDANGFGSDGTYEPAVETMGKYDVDGDGTKDNAYEISNAGQLYWFADLINKGSNNQNAVLTKDIVVNENVLNADGTLNNEGDFRAWTPIGNNNARYGGAFDGQDYTISGLYVNDDTATDVGLFGYINKGKVNDVGVVDSYFKGAQYVGGVCGYNNKGTITNCYNTGVVSGSENVGGVCGYCFSNNTITNSTITNCYNTGVVSGSENVGGVCGRGINSTIINCYNTGAVSGSSSYVGGVCGYNNSNSTITNCYNTGTVSGSKNVGGVCGYNKDQITNCYNTGAVSGSKYVGGVCGYNDSNSTITNCYNTGTVSGPSNYVGSVCVNTRPMGKITNCFYLDTCGKDSNATSKTAEEFASGEVAYLLYDGENGNDWGQRIGVDKSPVLGGDTVYKVKKYSTCNKSDTPVDGYSNSNNEIVPAHNYVNGFCTMGCDGYEPAKLTTDKYDVDGDGINDSAYEISNAGQLYWFARLVNGTLAGVDQNTSANAVLTENIVVNENVLKDDGTLNTGTFREWTPIGNSSSKYGGTFDGQSHTISGLYFNDDTAEYVGLFGFTSSGTIAGVGIVDSYFKGNDFVGGVCGYNDSNSTITNCYNTGNLTAIDPTASIGGICGYNYKDGTIENCYNTGTVTATGSIASVGGVCGCSIAPISNCYNIGIVTATSSGADISDICGYYFGPVTNCYYLADTEDENGGKTAVQFASGEIAYLLSRGCTVGEGENAVTYSGSVWGQNLATENYPIIGGDKVYKVKKYSTCNKSDTPVDVYSNSQDDIVAKHNYINGFCTMGCDGYEPAVETTDKYDVDDDGEFDWVYEISNAGQLYWFADFVNQGNNTRNAVLTADIVVNTGVLDNDGNLVSETGSFRKWTPIGGNTLESDEDPEGIVNNYFGTFNGMKHTISGLYCVGDSEKVGLFGGIDSGKVIDVGVIDSYFKGNGYAGAITAVADRPIISGCFSKSTVIGSSGVGGICGYVSDYYIKGSISNCYNTGIVNGGSSVGGICGDSVTNIYASYNTGKVSGTENIGGIIGNSDSDSSIVKDCYNSGDITATGSNVGGIAGWTRSSIETCYNTGSVSGKGYVGGIAGNADKLNRNDIVVNNCYNSGYVKAFGTEPQVDCVGGITGANYAVVKSCYNIGNVSGGIYDDDNAYLLYVSFISGFGVGDIDNCYYLEGCAENGDIFNNLDGASKTAEEFASGEVAYYLNFYGDKADLWKQTLDEQDRPNFTGKTVYAAKKYSGCKDAPGEFTLSFNNEGEQTIYANHTDSNNDGSCDYCKKLMEKFAGATVSLDSAIGLNFFMELSDVIASSDETYMLFTLKGGEKREVKGAAVENDGKTYYVFTCELAAKEMSDIVTAQLFFGEKAGEEYTYSVKKYAESIIANKNGDYNAESIALAKAMLNYGANSQTYFEYKTDDLANSSLSADDKALSTTTDSIADHKFTISSNKKVCTFVSAYLSLESKTKVNVYVDLADGVNADDVTFRVKGDEVKPTMKNGHYLLTVDGIEFPNLGEKFKFEVQYDNETATLEYGALSYCYIALAGDSYSQSLKNVSAAIADLYFAADTYVKNKAA